MSITVSGRKLVEVAALNGNVTSFSARPCYDHVSDGITFHIVPTFSTQWTLETPKSQGAEAEVYDSLEETVAAIDRYEHEQK